MFQYDGAPAHRARDTVAFLESKRDRQMRETRRRLSACVCVGQISSTNSDNFEPICHDD